MVPSIAKIMDRRDPLPQTWFLSAVLPLPMTLDLVQSLSIALSLLKLTKGFITTKSMHTSTSPPRPLRLPLQPTIFTTPPHLPPFKVAPPLSPYPSMRPVELGLSMYMPTTLDLPPTITLPPHSQLQQLQMMQDLQC